MFDVLTLQKYAIVAFLTNFWDILHVFVTNGCCFTYICYLCKKFCEDRLRLSNPSKLDCIRLALSL